MVHPVRSRSPEIVLLTQETLIDATQNDQTEYVL